MASSRMLPRDALLGHLAGGANRVAKLVDEQVVGVGGQGLFVALQRAVALHAVAGELHAQGDRHAVAGALGGLVEHLKDVVGAVADELLDPGRLQRFAGQLANARA
jgi:hypothetical protein